MYNFLQRHCITDRKLNFDMDYKLGQQGLQNGGNIRDYKSGQVQRLQNGAKGLQIGSGITKRGKKITNRCRTTRDILFNQFV